MVTYNTKHIEEIITPLSKTPKMPKNDIKEIKSQDLVVSKKKLITSPIKRVTSPSKRASIVINYFA